MDSSRAPDNRLFSIFDGDENGEQMGRWKPLRNKYFGMRHGESIPNTKAIIISHPIAGLHSIHSIHRLFESCSSLASFLIYLARIGQQSEHGLSDRGKGQAVRSSSEWIRKILNEITTTTTNTTSTLTATTHQQQPQNSLPVAIYTSNFSRAVQTATILKQQIEQYLLENISSKSNNRNSNNNSNNSSSNLPTNSEEEVPLTVTPHLRERFFGDEFEGQSNENYQRVWDEDAKDPNHHFFGSESATEVLKVRIFLIGMQIIDNT